MYKLYSRRHLQTEETKIDRKFLVDMTKVCAHLCSSFSKNQEKNINTHKELLNKTSGNKY